MSALGLAGGAAVAGIWKIATLLLAGLLLAVGAATGTGWWLAIAARDQALADLQVASAAAAELRASISIQNTAVEGMQRATAQAEARGDAARAAAAAAGRRYDSALARLDGAHATTCAEAMPAVNQLLESVR